MKPILIFILFCVFCALSSCKKEKEAEGYDAITNTGTEDSPVESGVLNENENPMDPDSSNNTSSSATIEGQYIKTDEATGENCTCYCIKIDLSSSSRLCLEPDNLYINARYEKESTNRLNVFFEGLAETSGNFEDIPWEEFDQNTPIARITRNSNGNIKVDWLGFSTSGDLALDYAIIGKETLEGTYKKK